MVPDREYRDNPKYNIQIRLKTFTEEFSVKVFLQSIVQKLTRNVYKTLDFKVVLQYNKYVNCILIF